MRPIDGLRPTGPDYYVFDTDTIGFAVRVRATGGMSYNSGAGAGKRKLARCICAIGYGRQPSAFTPGSNTEELEKRLAAKLVESAPAILVDNVNGVALKSAMLASAITESPAESASAAKRR